MEGSVLSVESVIDFEILEAGVAEGKSQGTYLLMTICEGQHYMIYI